MSCGNHVTKAQGVVDKYSSGIPYMGIPKVDLPVILAARHHGADSVRRKARYILSNVMDQNAGDLVGLLLHSDPGIRMEAVNTIGDSHNPRFIKPLATRLLNDSDSWVRARAAYSLARMGAPDRVMEYLDQARADKSQEVINAVNWAISNCYRSEAPSHVSMTHNSHTSQADIRGFSDEALETKIRTMEDAYREAYTSPRAEEEMLKDSVLCMFRKAAAERIHAHRPAWSGNSLMPYRRSSALEFVPQGTGLYDDDPEAAIPQRIQAFPQPD